MSHASQHTYQTYSVYPSLVSFQIWAGEFIVSLYLVSALSASPITAAGHDYWAPCIAETIHLRVQNEPSLRQAIRYDRCQSFKPHRIWVLGTSSRQECQWTGPRACDAEPRQASSILQLLPVFSFASQLLLIQESKSAILSRLGRRT
jgi:hypothetical protein